MHYLVLTKRKATNSQGFATGTLTIDWLNQQAILQWTEEA
jgi:hypothetical protein